MFWKATFWKYCFSKEPDLSFRYFLLFLVSVSFNCVMISFFFSTDFRFCLFFSFFFFCLPVHLLMHISVVSTFRVLCITLLWTLVYRYLFKSLLSVLFGRHLEVKLPDDMILLCSVLVFVCVFVEPRWSFLKQLHPFTFPQQCADVPVSPYPFQHLFFSSFLPLSLYNSHPNGGEVGCVTLSHVLQAEALQYFLADYIFKNICVVNNCGK